PPSKQLLALGCSAGPILHQQSQPSGVVSEDSGVEDCSDESRSFNDGDSFLSISDMEEEATQPSTQFPGTTSLESLEAFRNVLCLLIPESNNAKAIVRLLYLKGAYNVLACTINNDTP